MIKLARNSKQQTQSSASHHPVKKDDYQKSGAPEHRDICTPVFMCICVECVELGNWFSSPSGSGYVIELELDKPLKRAVQIGCVL